MLTAAVACLWMTFSAQNATVSIPLTAPEAPQSSTDVLLRTVLTNLLQKGYRELDPSCPWLKRFRQTTPADESRDARGRHSAMSMVDTWSRSGPRASQEAE
jgi:hypothetical protein